ncbi:MAG: hypothetical protein LBU87_07245 [Lactobacillales bacterium]|jgi:hypothetical protein|nr:hypothetical protein [Lactobacillales bacterium]
MKKKSLKLLLTFANIAWIIGVIYIVTPKTMFSFSPTQSYQNYLNQSINSKSEFRFKMPAQKVSAFMRVKNEIETIDASLTSIDGLFDRIVLIHSNEKDDDGTTAFLHRWCAARDYCEVYEYPHTVYPSLSREYMDGQVPYENSMAAYSNFGIDKFSPEEWIVNLDGDQVYIRERLAGLIQKIKSNYPENARTEYCMVGYNTFARNGVFVKVGSQPIMGTYCDHYATKRKNLKPYEARGYMTYILVQKGTKQRLERIPIWFHFKKTLKYPGRLKDKNTVNSEDVIPLKPQEIEVYQKYVAPYFTPNSPYHSDNLKFVDPEINKKADYLEKKWAAHRKKAKVYEADLIMY